MKEKVEKGQQDAIPVFSNQLQLAVESLIRFISIESLSVIHLTS